MRGGMLFRGRPTYTEQWGGVVFRARGRPTYTEQWEEGWSLEAGPLTLNNERRGGLQRQAHLHWTVNGRAVFGDRPTYTEQTEGRSSETGPLTLNNERSGALWRQAHLQLHWTITGQEVFRRYHLHQTMSRIIVIIYGGILCGLLPGVLLYTCIHSFSEVVYQGCHCRHVLTRSPRSFTRGVTVYMYSLVLWGRLPGVLL